MSFQPLQPSETPDVRCACCGLDANVFFIINGYGQKYLLCMACEPWGEERREQLRLEAQESRSAIKMPRR